MPAALKIAVAPTLEPVTVDEALAYCKAPSGQETSLFELWIAGARRQVEDYCGRALLTQRWDLVLDAWPDSGTPIEVPRPPLISVVSVTTYNAANVSAVCSSAVYQVDTYSEPGRIALVEGQSWPTGLRAVAPIVIRVEAGYGATRDTVPAPMREAVLALVAQRWANRSDVPGGLGLPPEVAERLAPFRLWSVA